MCDVFCSVFLTLQCADCLQGGLENSGKFLSGLKIFQLAVSLGAVESLACCPAIMTHASVPEQDRLKIGLTNSLVRLAIGIEHSDDLIEDLKQALDALQS